MSDGDLLKLYSSLALKEGPDLSFGESLYGHIPTTLEDILKSITLKTEIYSQDTMESFLGIIENSHRQSKTFTSYVKENLDNVDGFVEVAHQPLYLGGPVFLPNKVSLTTRIVNASNDLNLSPLFFIGDHDSVQNELTIARFPQHNSISGLALSFKKPPNFEGSAPMHVLPVPSESTIRESQELVRESYRGLFKIAGIDGMARQLLSERLEDIIELWNDTRLEQSSFSEWIRNLWSTLFILRNKLPIHFIRISDPEFRKIIVEGFEILLKQREKYILTLNETAEKIQSRGYNFHVPIRDSTYSPFYWECQACTERTRMDPEITNGIIQAHCQICGQKFTHEYNPSSPDLSDISLEISPRVDSRLPILSSLLPIPVRVSGAGET